MSQNPLPSWQPRKMQLRGVKLMLSQAAAGLLWKPGLGKTSAVYMTFRILQEKGFVNKMLVISPIRPMGIVWPNQCHDYADFDHFEVAVLHGKDKEKELMRDDADIYVINPEGLAWLFGAKFQLVNGKRKLVFDTKRVKYVTEKFQMLVVDESTKFKAYDTNRFKILKGVVGKFKRRYILTGSPRPKSLMDLFGQVYIMDEGESLGQYITHFRTKYFYPSGFGGFEWLPQPGAQDAIMEKLANLVDVEFAEGNVDLPELVFNDIWVELPPEARSIYDRMEDDMLAQVESGQVVAANAAVSSGKCRQIANGGLYHSDVPGEYTPIHQEKLRALEDLMEELQGDPVLITYEFAFDRDQIAEKLKVPCISTGSAKHDRDHIQLFSTGMLPAVMGHPASIALGIDGLQKECFNVCMFGITWDLLNYEQVIDRVRRSGNRSKIVFVHRILAKDTVDERVLQVINRRDKDQNDFMHLLKNYRK